MALSFLYRGNAELCSAMAAAAKSEEIRLQWIELAEHWRQKAELDERYNQKRGPYQTEYRGVLRMG
jgi:hypothetical protein